jgi:hypothetical protein
MMIRISRGEEGGGGSRIWKFEFRDYRNEYEYLETLGEVR